MQRDDSDIGIECASSLGSNLGVVTSCWLVVVQYKRRYKSLYQSFALLHVFFLEQKLSVQIGQVNSVQIEQSDFAESSEDNVFHCKQEVRSDTLKPGHRYEKLT